jgi:hypothetical protein
MHFLKKNQYSIFPDLEAQLSIQYAPAILRYSHTRQLKVRQIWKKGSGSLLEKKV